MNKIVGSDESLLSPELHVSAFNSSTVELTWNHRRNITDEEVCYNIEKDYTVNFHCILGNKLIIPMEKGNLIYTFRVRAITEGQLESGAIQFALFFLSLYPFFLRTTLYTETSTLPLSLWR